MPEVLNWSNCGSARLGSMGQRVVMVGASWSQDWPLKKTVEAGYQMGMGQNPIPLDIKIAGK